MLVNRHYSKRFLIAASAYRRHGCDFSGDFSKEALQECYEYESLGKRKPNTNNGYLFGKKALDITMKAMRQDYNEGLFCKAELKEAAPYFVRKEISKWMPVTMFSYINYDEKRKE